MLNCKQASALLSQSQDRQLGFLERLGLQLHLALCDGCTNFRRQLALMRAAIRRLRDDG